MSTLIIKPATQTFKQAQRVDKLNVVWCAAILAEQEWQHTKHVFS